MQRCLRIKWILASKYPQKNKPNYFELDEMPIAKTVHFGGKNGHPLETATRKAKVEQENIAGNVEAPVAFLTLFSINNNNGKNVRRAIWGVGDINIYII